jgi:Type II CAAX prenyl endopeptidase Rce1-like
MFNFLCVIDSISTHHFRIGMGNPCVVHLPPGPDDWHVWFIDREASDFFLVRLRSCDCSLYHRSLPWWMQRDSEFPFPLVPLALLSPLWYVFLFIGIPLVFYVGSAVKGTLFEDPFPFTSVWSLCAALIFAAIKGPVEEFGWRGLALPLLQRKFVPIWAGLILGVIWGCSGICRLSC